jgi:hypothetical protein
MVNKNPQNPKLNNENNTKHKPIIGKIYSKQCIYCKLLEPQWKLMENRINRDKVDIKDIEDNDMSIELDKINTTILKNAENKLELQGGFPTLFSIKDNKVEYYNGDRDEESLIKWVESTVKSSTTKYAQKNKYTNGGKSRKSRKNVRRTRRQKGWLTRTLCSLFSLARITL